MNNVLYWLWLQKALGFHAQLLDLIRVFGSAKEFYEAGEAQWRSSGIFGSSLFEVSPKKIEALKETKLTYGENIIKYCQNCGIDIVTPDDENYPPLLKLISDFPAVLFVKGDLSCLKDRLPIAVIGTRRPSLYGIHAAEKISRGIAKENTVIISGGALGIDSIAHKSAVEEGAKTVLVMGCGHGAGYLFENEELRQSVSLNGAVISEYPPLTKAAIHYFPKRNRIISGISKGVVIIEAGEKSGTLNTAAHARAQHRDVFAVPGDISSVSYQGSNKLITSGAHAVFSAEDVLNFYSDFVNYNAEIESAGEKTPFEDIDKFAYGEVPKKSIAKKKKTEKEKVPKENSAHVKKFIKINAESVSENAFLVYNHMSGEEMSLDEITRACSLPVRKVLTALTELEMFGAIVSCSGNRYSLKEEN